MARFLRIPGVKFTDNSLPLIQPYEDRVKQILGLKGWFRARTDTFLTDQGAVWADESDSKLNFRQLDESMIPELINNAVKGHAALRWSGDKSINLIWDGQTDVSSTAKTTRIAVCKVGDVAGYVDTPFVFSSFMAAGNAERNSLYYRYSSSRFEYGVDSSVNYSPDTGLEPGQWCFVICSYDENTNKSSISVNGRQASSVNISEPVTLSSELVLGSSRSTGASSFNGDIAEFMYVESDLLAPENSETLNMLIGYLSTKYGI